MRKRDYSEPQVATIDKVKDFCIQLLLGAIAITGIVLSIPMILNSLF